MSARSQLLCGGGISVKHIVSLSGSPPGAGLPRAGQGQLQRGASSHMSLRNSTRPCPLGKLGELPKPRWVGQCCV